MSDPSGRTKQQRQASPSTSDEYLYLNYLREYNRSLGPIAEAISQFVRKFNHFVMIILGAYVCNNDLMAGHEQSAHFSSSWSYCRRRRRDGPRALEITVPTNPENDVSDQTVGWIYVKRLLKRVLPKPVPRSCWRQNLKMAWLVFAIQAIYAAAATVLLINLPYLYRYHMSRLRLERVRCLIRAHGPSQRVALDDKILGDGLISLSRFTSGATGNGSLRMIRSHEIVLSLVNLEQIFETQANVSRQTLSYLGDSFIQWGMINELGYLGTLLLGFGLFGVVQVLYLYCVPAGTRLHRDLIDAKEEERRVNAFCEAEVLKYLESSRVYATIIPSDDQFFLDDQWLQSPIAYHYLYFDTPNHQTTDNLVLYEDEEKSRHKDSKRGGAREQRHQKQLGDSLDMRDRYELMDGAHRANRLLLRLLVSGALRPLNSSKRWTGLINLGTAALIFIIILVCLLLIHVVAYAFHLTEAHSLDLDVKCLLILLFFHTLAVTFHVVSLFVACLEQAILVNRCLSTINDCVRLNQQLFECLDLNRATSSPDIEKIGSNYLFTLMTYKIFVAQLVSFRRTFRSSFLLAFSVAFIMPVLMHIHMPYLQAKNEVEAGGTHKLRLVTLIISLIFLTLADTVCLPVCCLHSYCPRLYRALSSLLAHITEVRTHEKGAGIYDEHSVTLLLKELANPKQMLEQFSVDSIGISGTFSTLVKMHFWWGLAELSALLGTSDSYKQSNMFGSFLSDPLGVWCFRLI